MKSLKKFVFGLAQKISLAILRFPFTIFCLVSISAILCYMIAQNTATPLWLQKSIFALSVGAVLGMLAQVAIERFHLRVRSKAAVYGGAILLVAVYFALLLPMPQIVDTIIIRTLVGVFAIVCMILWMPAFKGGADFNSLALIHVSSAATAIFYSGVLFAGVAAILLAIDSLLFSIDSDSYAYSAVLVWVLFCPIYYLSQLPVFDPHEKERGGDKPHGGRYTRFLEILISYIAIPLFTVYTLVLLIYMLKILVTMVWPIGQLGPMVLVYSAVGIVLFVLSSLPENRVSKLFIRIFPKVWIPIILMQMFSVYIRLRAYGITESRYYVALFAVFSLVSAILLCIKPVGENSKVALLAAVFAIISILPPIDAFTMSRNSQIERIEKYLSEEGMLVGGELIPNEQASLNTKVEVTNILAYLEYNHSLNGISWLADDFEISRDMEKAFGFGQTWGSLDPEEYKYLYFSLDPNEPIDISGYDTFVTINSYRYWKGESSDKDIRTYPITARGGEYTLEVERLSPFEVVVTLRDANSSTLVFANLYDFLKELEDKGSMENDLPPQELTFIEENKDARIKIIFQNVNATLSQTDGGADYNAHILIKVP